MEVTNSMRVEKFDGRNFRQWKFQVNCALKARGLDINSPKPVEKQSQWLKEDGMAMFIITSSMELNQISLIENCESALEIMNKLESIYEQKSEYNKMMVHEKFYQYKMLPTDSIAQHISKVENLAKQLRESGENISEMAVMTKILSTLPASYRSLRQAWLSLDSSKQTIHNLTSRLLDEEASLTTEDENETALLVAKKPMTQYKHNNNNEKGSTSHTQHRFICYNCNKRGHFARDCRAPKKSGKKPQEQKNMLAFSAEHCLQSEVDTDVWILDSGASVHMSYRRDFFHELQDYTTDPNSDRKVRLGNQKEIEVHGKGTVMIKKYLNGQWEQSVLTEVLYVPDLRRNLFSEGAATRKGYVINKKNRDAIILKENSVVMTASLKHNNLYELNVKTISQESCNLVHTSLKLWHERLGHLNIKEVQNMAKNGAIMVSKTDNNEEFMCEACQYGKQSRLPFQKSSRMPSEPGDIVYSDVCGPLEHTSVSGAKYFVLFKDGATSYRHIYIIKNKSDVISCFKKYSNIVENMFQHGIKILHTDNGREYVNQDFREYLDKKGIVHECTAPYTPEQNGRAEREMRTIMESARSMLHAKDMPLNLWAEAASCSVYLLNRSSSSQTKNVSPYELWYGEKPRLDHIKVFGSEGYVHVPDQKRKKLDKKSRKLILVGYDNNNYRMFDVETKKITISRNVRFNENSLPVFKMNNNNQITLTEGEREMEIIHTEEPLRSEHQTTASPSTSANADEVLSEDSLQSCLDENDETYEPSRILNDVEKYNIRLRPRRNRAEEANLVEFTTPSSYEEAMQCNDSVKWKEAIREELQSHEDNNTWSIIEHTNQKTITSKWVFCIKRNIDGSIDRYKARLCARGFAQVKDIDYKETFSPTVRYNSIRVLLSIAAKEKYEIEQFDVKTAFLYGELTEDVYMEIPEGVKVRPGNICKLNKSLYGLKQSSRCWNKKFTSFLLTYGFEMCQSDNCIFVGSFHDCKVILILYVDDALLFSKSKHILSAIINDLKNVFKIKVLQLYSFVGMEICGLPESITIHQKQYTEQIIERFGMLQASPCNTPADSNVILTRSENIDFVPDFPYREAVGALLFLSSVSRPDIAYAVNIVSRYINNPNKEHINAVKRIIRYLIKTKNMCITYNCSNELTGFCDSDFAADLDSRKSNSGYVFMLNGGPITWASRKQNTVALSTTESEYVAASEAAKEILWLRQLLCDIGQPQNSVCLYIDNQSTIKLIHNPVYHKRSKHIDVRYNFIREKVEENIIEIKYVKSACQLADFLTKALPTSKFEYNRDKVLNNMQNM